MTDILTPSRGPQSPKGRYSNTFRAGFNAFEFLFEFGHDHAGAEDLCLHTRIITAPVYAKAFARVLATALEEYERKHGTIPEQTK